MPPPTMPESREQAKRRHYRGHRFGRNSTLIVIGWKRPSRAVQQPETALYDIVAAFLEIVAAFLERQGFEEGGGLRLRHRRGAHRRV